MNWRRLKKQLLAKNYKYARPGIEDMPWGTRDMSVADPFGNRLTFTSAISTYEGKCAYRAAVLRRRAQITDTHRGEFPPSNA